MVFDVKFSLSMQCIIQRAEIGGLQPLRQDIGLVSLWQLEDNTHVVFDGDDDSITNWYELIQNASQIFRVKRI